MAPGGTSAQTLRVCTDERLKNALRLQIDRIVNIERSKTRAQLAEETGVNIYTIDGILSPDPAKKRRLKAEDMMSLIWGMDERAVNAMLAMIHYGGAEKIDQPSGAPAMERVADAICEVGIVASAVARGGGRIRHGDDKQTRAAADKAIRDMLPFSSFAGDQ
jgi:hypothetical protein